MARKATLYREIAEEAAEWAARIDSGPLDAGDRARLASWLATSPVHVDELLLSASFLAGLSALDRPATRSIEALLAKSAPEIIPLFTASRELPTSAKEEDAAAPARRWGLAGWGIGAVAASLLVLLASTLPMLRGAPDSFGPANSASLGNVEAGTRLLETDFGEQRSIVLEDGSVLYINTKSQLRVTLSDVERRVELLSGEALFEVAHDPDRPFRVHAGGTVAQAVGTKFNVRQTAEGVSVVVVEGKVLVGKARDFLLREPALPSRNWAPGAHDQLLVVAGDQADLPVSGKRPTVSTADLATAISWRQRKVAFSDQGLAAIASEFNRYNRQKILVASKGLGHLRFSGVFDADDPDSFVAFLELTAGVEVDKSHPRHISLKPARSLKGYEDWRRVGDDSLAANGPQS